MSRKRERPPDDGREDDGPWLDPARGAAQAAAVRAAGRRGRDVLATGAVGRAGRCRRPRSTTRCADACRRHRLPLLRARRCRRGAGLPVPTASISPGPSRSRQPRRQLGRERLIGVACGLSRHAAMVAGEAGADYVLFGSLDLTPPGARRRPGGLVARAVRAAMRRRRPALPRDGARRWSAARRRFHRHRSDGRCRAGPGAPHRTAVPDGPLRQPRDHDPRRHQGRARCSPATSARSSSCRSRSRGPAISSPPPTAGPRA